ncbi:MAG: methyltransferase domain-containing protein [Planctomycetota bacterium]|nr:methyltransferase domain-containing protein [Planctomycetota bacterium]
MRETHVEAFAPVCPLCRARDGSLHRLAVGSVARRDGTDIAEGSLVCAHAPCACEYPILDGAPIIVPDVRRFVSDNFAALTARDDLSDLAESMLADCAGPGTAYTLSRRYLSIYARDHYADLDPDEAPDEPAPPGAALRTLRAGLGLLGPAPLPPTPSLDVGCATGRATFELASSRPGLVLGVDVNVALLRLARRVLSRGEVSYPRRDVGIVHQRRTFRADFPGADRVDFWVCDAAALPLADASCGLVTALNVVDATPSPLGVLRELARVGAPGAGLVLSTPYDWEGVVTPVEAWIGGHSQRAVHAGRSEPLLRQLLTPGAHPASIQGVRIVGEIDRFPWRLRIHDRSVAAYDAHVIAARLGEPR